MAAGDVLFVGWTGGDPQYKELPPQIQIEPAARLGFINKRVTINRICFDKDKAAVVANLPTGNAALSSVYIDTDGSIKTQALGGGYDLLSVSDASVASGFSRVSAQYAKTASGIFEVGLPEGLLVACEDGVCKIKYLSHTLEEIDSGTGECTSGLDLQINTEQQIITGLRPLTDTYLGLQSGELTVGNNIVWSGTFYFSDPALTHRTVEAKNLESEKEILNLDILCNGVIFENITLKNSDVFDSLQLTYKGAPLRQGIVQASAQSDALQPSERAGIIQQAIFAYEANPIPGTMLDSLDLEEFRRVVLSAEENGPVLQDYPIYYRLMPTYKLTYANWNYAPQLEWKKSGSTITLQYGRATIREYDITGLT